MNRHINIDTIEVVDKEGRRSRYLEQRNMLFIGCDSDEKIHVEPDYRVGEKVWYVQATAQPNYCLLVNMGVDPIQFAPDSAEAGDSQFRPQDTKQIVYGQTIRANGCSLTFHRKRISKSIEVDLFLPAQELIRSHTKETPLEGIITLHNKGEKTKVQFQLEVKIEGLPDKAYHLDSPHPKLVHVRERQVNLYLYHPPNGLATAGYYRIDVTVKANEYPDQVAADFQQVYVRPFYDYQFEIDIDNKLRCQATGDGESE